MNKNIYPMLSLRDLVVMPGVIIPLFVGREKSIKALEASMNKEIEIFLATQHDTNDDNPSKNKIYKTGVLATIIQMLKLPDGTVKVLVESKKRALNVNYTDNEEYLECEIKILEDKNIDNIDIETLKNAIIDLFEKYAKINSHISPDLVLQVSEIKDASKLADTISSHLPLKIIDKQKILKTVDVVKRLETVYGSIEGLLSIAEVEQKIKHRVKRQMEKTQHEYYLSEQIKAIQKELGDDTGKEDIQKLEELGKKKKFPKEVRQRFEAELKKLKTMSPQAAEAAVIRNYLDWMVELPWGKKSRIEIDIKKSMEMLDAGHFGLAKVKERIIEHLAVQKRSKKIVGPILCFVGPPGVGKTSLGKSIAKSCKREFIRISLGGLRDEAEIRGHRRTYIGAMPGKIIQSFRNLKTSNPVIMLDELDKMGSDYRGDPSYALLELLDPEQNNAFKDHYLDLPYDLSNALFIATSNSLDMPSPLLDRMEIIRIPGYLDFEKKEIAKNFLLKRLEDEHLINKDELTITDKVYDKLIDFYTREAGVRGLNRELSNIVRKVVKKLEEDSNIEKPIKVTANNVAEYAGPEKFSKSYIDEKDQIGVVNGLAWTRVGGEILKIEIVKMPGKGKLVPTGNLKEIMKESISTAMSYIRARSEYYGLNDEEFQKYDFHLHVPEGATPKDGPSAGIAMATAIISLLTGVEIKRDIAMTGEITLRGQVLAIGGLKEKLLGALRAKVKTVLIPHDNIKDLAEVSDVVKKNLEIIPVKFVEEVINYSLVKKVGKANWPLSNDKTDKEHVITQ